MLLVHQAQQHGAISGPPGMSIEFELLDDGDDGAYRFLLDITQPTALTIASQPREMKTLQENGTCGIDAAMSVLQTAVVTANQLHSQLRRFVTAISPHRDQ